MRPGTDMQTLGALKPAFKDMGEVMPGFDKVAMMKYPHLERINHIHHAGNSSGIVDGAAAILIGPRLRQGKRAETPRPHPRHGEDRHRSHDHADRPGSGDPEDSARLRPDHFGDIDLFEVNEAFASVVLRFQQAFDVDPALVNVNGGAIAMGHPLGATGAIIIGTLLDELERQDKAMGLATLCIASGMGAATIIERV
jgi:acetyl-CoA C-acetyltransferase